MPSTKSYTAHLSTQCSMFNSMPQVAKKAMTLAANGRKFITGEPNKLYYGTLPLKQYLEENGERDAFIIRNLLEEQNWRAFESAYSHTGRAPYAPMAMMGLIVLAIINGVHSLRGIKKFARFNLAAQWVSGGICPQFSIIGEFINKHSARIQGDFFIELTQSIIQKTNSSCAIVAGDGTIIEAACSSYNLLKEEAAYELCKKAQQELTQQPDDAAKKKNLAQAQEAYKVVTERAGAARSKGRNPAAVLINPTEPEACVQRGKNGRGNKPAYVPGVLANTARIIVGHDVHPSNEIAMLPKKLDQAQAIAGRAPEELVLDKAYLARVVVKLAKKRGIKVRCPEKICGVFDKRNFIFDEQSNSYTCLAGHRLIETYREANRVRYASKSCGACALKSKCTTSKTGRVIYRYHGDAEMAAWRASMAGEDPRKYSNLRAASVETVYSMIRGVQQLNRFRRRGLAAVRLEFGMHAVAYNVNRLIALSQPKMI